MSLEDTLNRTSSFRRCASISARQQTTRNTFSISPNVSVVHDSTNHLLPETVIKPKSLKQYLYQFRLVVISYSASATWGSNTCWRFYASARLRAHPHHPATRWLQLESHYRQRRGDPRWQRKSRDYVGIEDIWLKPRLLASRPGEAVGASDRRRSRYSTSDHGEC